MLESARRTAESALQYDREQQQRHTEMVELVMTAMSVRGLHSSPDEKEIAKKRTELYVRSMLAPSDGTPDSSVPADGPREPEAASPVPLSVPAEKISAASALLEPPADSNAVSTELVGTASGSYEETLVSSLLLPPAAEGAADGMCS